jgi:hypothetical protein
MEHAHEVEGAARGPARDIDEQILAMWRALRVNPSLDARWAMQVIDRLLDQRPRPAQVPPSGPMAAATSPGLVPGSPAQQAVLASVVRALLTDEPG